MQIISYLYKNIYYLCNKMGINYKNSYNINISNTTKDINNSNTERKATNYEKNNANNIENKLHSNVNRRASNVRRPSTYYLAQNKRLSLMSGHSVALALEIKRKSATSFQEDDKYDNNYIISVKLFTWLLLNYYIFQ